MIQNIKLQRSSQIKEGTELNVKSSLFFKLYNEMLFYHLNFHSEQLRKVGPAFFKYLLMMICEPN